MRVLVLSQYYDPEPVPIPAALAQGLTARGHDVRVLTGYPNYPEGRLASGYRQRRRHSEMINGIEVHRARLFISHSRNPLGRIASYLSFALNAAFYRPAFADIDVVYVYATQMTAAIPAHRWKRKWAVPFVLHIQDLWPESVTGSSILGGGVSGLVGGILGGWLTRMYRSASAVVAIGPRMRSILVERGAPVDHTYDVFNWAQLEDVVQRTPHHGTTIMYAGNLGAMQDLETVVRAAASVASVDGLRVVIVGAGVEETRLRTLATKLAADNVQFLGRVSPTEMAALYAESDFQLVTLRRLPIFEATVPSKLQASLAAGIPVITTVAGDVAELVLQNGLGFVSEPEDVEALAATFRAAHETSGAERDDVSQRCRSFYTHALSRERGIDAIEKILAGRARPRPQEGRV